MGKWIDADALIDDLYEHEFSNWCDKDEVSTLINDAPSIDIVRCKECKHRYVSGHTTQYYICDFLDAQNKDDGFCSYGQKGDENVETD